MNFWIVFRFFGHVILFFQEDSLITHKTIPVIIYYDWQKEILNRKSNTPAAGLTMKEV